MEPSFTIRPALPADAEPIFSILSEVACQVPIDLSTPERVEKLKAKVDDCVVAATPMSPSTNMTWWWVFSWPKNYVGLVRTTFI